MTCQNVAIRKTAGGKQMSELVMTRALNVVGAHDWKQIVWETGEPEIRRVGRELRRRGYLVIVASIGRQVSDFGAVKMTMMTVRPGKNPNTCFPYTWKRPSR